MEFEFGIVFDSVGLDRVYLLLNRRKAPEKFIAIDTVKGINTREYDCRSFAPNVEIELN